MDDPTKLIMEKQQELHRQLVELQRANFQLMILIQEDEKLRKEREKENHSPKTNQTSPPRTSNAKTNSSKECSYFFRVHNIRKLAEDGTRCVYSPDWYTQQLGFRGCFSLSSAVDLYEVTLQLCFFGASESVKFRVRTSVIGVVDPNTRISHLAEPWIVGEKTGVIESTESSLDDWARGFRVYVSRSALEQRALIKCDGLLVRFDVSILAEGVHISNDKKEKVLEKILNVKCIE